MKFNELLKGTRARKTIELDLGLPDGPVKVDLRILSAVESADVIVAARKFAIASGIESPSESDPLYEYGVQLHTVARACIDPDSKVEEPLPFFASVDEILGSDVLTREHVLYLFAHYQIWEDACSPRKGELSESEFISLVARSAGGDMGPFCSLRPGTQWDSFRSMAALYLNSHAANSSSTSDSLTPN